MNQRLSIIQTLWSLLVWGAWGTCLGFRWLRHRCRKLSTYGMAVAFCLMLVGSAVAGREGYRLFALRHGMAELSAHSSARTDDELSRSVQLRAFALGFHGALEEGQVSVSTQLMEHGVKSRIVAIELAQPLNIGPWQVLVYPVRVQVEEVVVTPLPRPDQE